LLPSLSRPAYVLTVVIAIAMIVAMISRMSAQDAPIILHLLCLAEETNNVQENVSAGVQRDDGSDSRWLRHGSVLSSAGDPKRVVDTRCQC
jgi:hypothetical protein